MVMMMCQLTAAAVRLFGFLLKIINLISFSWYSIKITYIEGWFGAMCPCCIGICGNGGTAA